MPLLLNPAQTAAVVGELRGGVLYRNQWRAVDEPFTTIAAYADRKLFLKGFDLGVGLSILNDRSGPGRLNVLKIYPSASIRKSIGKHQAIIGVQPGFVHKRIKDITFPSQYDNSIGGYNSSLPNGEIGGSYRKPMFDLNVGVKYILREEKFEITFGQAFQHVNLPNESLVSSNINKLPVRYTTHASYLHQLTEKVYIMPSVLFMSHNKATEFALNVHCGYKIVNEENNQITVRFGTAYRNNIQNVVDDSFFSNSDAVSVLAGASWNKIEFDFAYDINVSSVSEGGSNAGAFEMALTYKNIFERKNATITVPCRRY